jgi:hypothetical protein
MSEEQQISVVRGVASERLREKVPDIESEEEDEFEVAEAQAGHC